MRVINYFESDRTDHWLSEIKRGDWSAAGFVYTFPEHRGHRYIGLLMDEVERLAKTEGVSEVYISTDHVGLYEKYGCEFKAEMKDMAGEISRVYVKRIGDSNS